MGKLSKLNSALKSSFRKLGHTRSEESLATVDSVDDQSMPALGLQTVYVGKSRKVYQISSQIIEHPSFKGLIITSDNNSDGFNDNNNIIKIGCEVVLFEHLLWMLENIDPQTESLDDLVSFYAN